jgi:hypothetical protein
MCECSLCEAVGLAPTPVKAMQLIDRYVTKKMATVEHFKPILDKILGTEEPEVDESADEAFERMYRGR